MPKQTDLSIVREWCVSLGILTAISISRQEAEMKLAAYVPLLINEFPPGAFTAASLQHVARKSIKGFPTYAELANHLSAWWRKHRPVLALPPPEPQPERTPPTVEEIAAAEATTREAVAWLLAHERPNIHQRPQPRYLTPTQLDQLNPLPNGRKRVAWH